MTTEYENQHSRKPIIYCKFLWHNYSWQRLRISWQNKEGRLVIWPAPAVFGVEIKFQFLIRKNFPLNTKFIQFILAGGCEIIDSNLLNRSL